MRLLANKQWKKNSLFSYIRLQKQHRSLMYWLKICNAWVRSQLRWAWNWLKLTVTSSNVLRIIIHWLSAHSDVGLTQGSLIPREHSLYRALKHSICQHKLDLSKTKQRLPIITNSHLNFRYLKIPKISPSMYKPLELSRQKTVVKTPLQIAPKYKVKQSKNGKFPSNYNASPIDFETQISLSP